MNKRYCSVIGLSHWMRTPINDLKADAEKVCHSFSSRLDEMGDEAKHEVSRLVMDLARELHLNWKHLNIKNKEVK